MAILSTDLSEKQIKQLNELRAKQATGERARKEYQRAFEQDCKELHLSNVWYSICELYGILNDNEEQSLMDHICSQRQIDYFNKIKNTSFY